MNGQPIATRAHGLEMLREFAPLMGRTYAEGRNYDHGPGAHRSVSRLSPYIRRRLVTEEEVVRTAIAAHGPEEAAKFVQEVVWRGYFKGWLEHRPEVWDSYVAGVRADLAAAGTGTPAGQDLARAETGRTGLACFDAWAAELVETGYLHNHARMWFASIWIFTLRLPWRLGADFFYRHLLDGDAVSNTLGWRWVAGLHTRGKPYAAEAWNIARFTGGRFHPGNDELAEVTGGLESLEPDGLPPAAPLRKPRAPDPGIPTAILITDEDCRIEEFDLDRLDLRAAATLETGHLRSSRPVAGAVLEFERSALADAALRAGLDAERLVAGTPQQLALWAERAGVTQIVTPFVPRGPVFDWLQDAAPALATRGITLCEWQRRWDRALWPHTTAGFFKVKRRIPEILGEVHAA